MFFRAPRALRVCSRVCARVFFACMDSPTSIRVPSTPSPSDEPSGTRCRWAPDVLQSASCAVATTADASTTNELTSSSAADSAAQEPPSPWQYGCLEALARRWRFDFYLISIMLTPLYLAATVAAGMAEEIFESIYFKAPLASINTSFVVLQDLGNANWPPPWLYAYAVFDLSVLGVFTMDLLISSLADPDATSCSLHNLAEFALLVASFVLSSLVVSMESPVFFINVRILLAGVRLVRTRTRRFVRSLDVRKGTGLSQSIGRFLHAAYQLQFRGAAEDQKNALLWSSDGMPVKLDSPRAGKRGYHLFLSHAWKHGQDTAGTIKSALRSLVPSCVVFLDVDDLLNIRRLEHYIRMSDVVLIILTTEYLSSRNCRRELTAAIHSNKPILLLLESDYDKGATDSSRLHAEFENLDSSVVLSKQEREAALELLALLDAPDAADSLTHTPLPIRKIEWHREKQYKEVALKCIAASVLACAPAADRKSATSSHHNDPSACQESNRSSHTPRKPRGSLFALPGANELVCTVPTHLIQGLEDVEIAGNEETAAKESTSQSSGEEPQSVRVVQISSHYRALAMPIGQVRVPSHATIGAVSSVFDVLKAHFEERGGACTHLPLSRSVALWSSLALDPRPNGLCKSARECVSLGSPCG